MAGKSGRSARSDRSASPWVSVKGVAITSRAVGLVVLAVAGVWFIAGNTQSVRIRLWVPTVWAPLWLVLAITAVVALAFGWFLHRRRSR
ncbi:MULTISPECIES: LapA family protein [Streptomyces]|uniref:LapA family protein n=2 Tax=Streptomyces TaxID=1883 RepID=A0A4Q9I0N6_STRKA|nr:LapA family protein [Streptomyces kasugaensis]MYU51920.1 DUF1049 domain-containing protein [Streptomyces sp. SID7805]TBO60935.1 LapA family protein [Streptomyces kasugaensis]